MENFTSNLQTELNNTEVPKKTLNSKVSLLMDIKTFEEGVRKGMYTDDKGTAYIVINGALNTTYNVYIDRQRITKAGSVVSFEGLLKNYSPEEIQIRYDVKEQRMPSVNAYRDINNKESNYDYGHYTVETGVESIASLGLNQEEVDKFINKLGKDV